MLLNKIQLFFASLKQPQLGQDLNVHLKISKLSFSLVFCLPLLLTFLVIFFSLLWAIQWYWDYLFVDKIMSNYLEDY